tara:strand:- start:38476 stop:38925 length:450 start_codon:yes stop_codon:yes gene_type:complete
MVGVRYRGFGFGFGHGGHIGRRHKQQQGNDLDLGGVIYHPLKQRAIVKSMARLPVRHAQNLPCSSVKVDSSNYLPKFLWRGIPSNANNPTWSCEQPPVALRLSKMTAQIVGKTALLASALSANACTSFISGCAMTFCGSYRCARQTKER